MTAEIAIMNRNGVALAADSAVSLGTSGKVYNSANKLFALSKKHPVGIMVNGRADFLGVPWELLIKHYRFTILKDKSFKTIEGYLNSFLRFLANTKLITKNHELEIVNLSIENLVENIRKHLVFEMQQKFHNERNPIQHTKITDTMISIVKNFVNESLKNAQIKPCHSQQRLDQLKKKYYPHIYSNLKALFKSKFSFIPLDAICGNLIELIMLNLSTLDCELVVAGYGDNEVYPVCINIEISCDLRVEFPHGLNLNINKISNLDNACIVPFAQREMVYAFMTGIDPRYKQAIIDNLQGKIANIQELIAAMAEIEQNRFTAPVMGVTAALPLAELAAMANHLVNLTSFKRRVTMVPESVGGPIDVAVISKGDGFIWINRKHYFKPELNPDYLVNRNRGMQ